jgi:DNA-binding MurR/RpiR family transcriptional regulator
MESFAQTVEACGADLTPVERRVADALLAARAEAAFLPVAEMARRAGADPAAAVRLARKLGYAGYRALKSALQTELLTRDQPSHRRLERRVAPLEGGAILSSMIDAEIAGLEGLRRQLDEAALMGAAHALRKAGRTFVYGQGHATALVDLLTRRLNRHGYVASAMREGEWGAAEAIAPLARGDALVVFAFYDVPPLVPALIGHAARRSAASVLISDLPGARPGPKPDHSLTATRGRAGESHTLGVPMLIVTALTLALARIDGGKSMAALSRLDTLKADLDSVRPARRRPRSHREGDVR